MRKRVLSHLILTLVVLLTGLAFTACSDDDNNGPVSNDKFTTEYDFEIQFSEDVLKTADIKAYIHKPNGEVYSQELTNAQDKILLSGEAVPDKAGIRFDFTPKSNVADGEYEIVYTAKAKITVYSDGKIFSEKSDEAEETYTVSAKNLVEFYHTSMVVAGEVSSDGEPLVTDGFDIDFGINSDDWDSWFSNSLDTQEGIDEAARFEQLFFYRDENGTVQDRQIGVALDPNDPGKLYVGAYSYIDAEEVFLDWIPRYDNTKVHNDQHGNINYYPTNKDGNSQGVISFKRILNSNEYGSVTFSKEVPITLFREIVFMDFKLFPENSIYFGDFSDIIVDGDYIGARAWHKNPENWPEGNLIGYVYRQNEIVYDYQGSHWRRGTVIFVLPDKVSGRDKILDDAPDIIKVENLHRHFQYLPTSNGAPSVYDFFKDQGCGFDGNTMFWSSDMYTGSVLPRRWAATPNGKRDWFNIKPKNPKKRVMFIRYY